MRDIEPIRPPTSKPTIRSLYADIDGLQTRPMNYRKMNAASPELPTTLTESIEANYTEAQEMLKKAMARYHEFNTGVNFIDDDGDRRHDKRQVIYGFRVVTGDGNQVCYDRMRAEADVRHWREYLNWASAKENGRGYEKP